jgi:hypothetical protein
MEDSHLVSHNTFHYSLHGAKFELPESDLEGLRLPDGERQEYLQGLKKDKKRMADSIAGAPKRAYEFVKTQYEFVKLLRQITDPVLYCCKRPEIDALVGHYMALLAEMEAPPEQEKV